MLTELRAQNYKSYGSHTVLPLKRLTVFLGKNNSGKTAAIRIPLLLSTGLNGEEQTRRSVLPLRVRGLRYGSSIRDLIRGHSPHGQMALGASMCTEDARSIDVDVTIQSRQSLEQGASGFVSSFSSNLLADSVSWDPESSSETAIQYGARAVGFKGLVPRFDDERSVAADVIRKEFGGFLENLVHLTAMRSPTLPLYEQRTSTHQPSPDGAEVPFFLMRTN